MRTRRTPERLVRGAECFGSSLFLASDLAPFCVETPAWGFREEKEGEKEEEEEEERSGRPRSPRPLLSARARRRQRQWHPSGLPCDVSPRAVFPSVDDRPQMLDIMAGMEQKNSYVLLFLLLALCFLPCLEARDARHHGRFGPEGFWHVQGLTDNFTFFYVYVWFTDPEVDSRRSLRTWNANIIFCPLYLTVTCSWRRLRSTVSRFSLPQITS